MKKLFVLLLFVFCFFVFTACTEEELPPEDAYTETYYIETEFQGSSAYDLTEEHNKVKEMLSENKELFTQSALLLLRQETEVLLIFDEGTLTRVNPGDNNFKSADEFFSGDEKNLLTQCYDKISEAFPNCRSICIEKVSTESKIGIYSDCVQFMIRTDFGSDYIDFGMVYSEENMDPRSYKFIDENWYGFTFALV